MNAEGRFRALLVGFYGEGNLGDQAILQGIISSIPEPAAFAVTSGVADQTPGVAVTPRRGLCSWLPFLHALKMSSHIVFSGGILQDWTFEGITFYALRLLAARAFGRQIGLWGAGLGPIRSQTARVIVRNTLACADEVWLRDRESLKLYQSFSLRNAKLGADWSWALTKVAKRCRRSCNFIGLNLRPWFDPKWLQIARNNLGSGRLHDRILGISARNEDTCALKNEFPNIEIAVPKSFEELLGLSDCLKEAWVMRFHVILAMLRSNIPIYPLSYDVKAESICREAGIDPEIVRPQKASGSFPVDQAGRFAAMREAFRMFLEK